MKYLKNMDNLEYITLEEINSFFYELNEFDEVNIFLE